MEAAFSTGGGDVILVHGIPSGYENQKNRNHPFCIYL